MKITQAQTMEISALDLPGDIAKRRRAPHVRELAASIRANGLAHLPIISGDNKMVVGRDRVAALMELGATSVEVRRAIGTPDELKALELTENIHRRHDDIDKMRAEYVEVMARVIEQQRQLDAGKPQKPGRPKSPRGEAMDTLAAASGVTSAAIRQSLSRAKADEEPEEPEPTGPLPSPVETWDVEVGHLAQEFAALRIVQAAFDEAKRHLRAARMAIGALADGSEIAKSLYSVIYAGVDNSRFEVESRRPAALCPYCKGLLHLRALCTGCSTVGYVGEGALAGIDDTLKLRGDKAMVFAGVRGIVAYRIASLPTAHPRPAPTAKKLDIQDAEGQTIDIEEEDLF
jgi:hypothetical protein